jgi:hypothetical protein
MNRPEPLTLPLDRRSFLKSGAAAALAGVLGGASTPVTAAAAGQPRRSDAIQRENQRPGDDWQLTRVRLDRADGRTGVRSRWIEGYCSHQSIEAGQRLDVMVSTDPARAFTLEVFRMGYYG